MAEFEARRAELEKAAAEKFSDAEARAAKMAEIELTLTAKLVTKASYSVLSVLVI